MTNGPWSRQATRTPDATEHPPTAMEHPATAPEYPPLAVEFHGRAGEWFGIWIVNLLLTIVTFGIYSAWAKVRRKKYFHQHTIVAGRGFDYHATGRQILIGRLIVLAGFIVYSVLAAVPLLAAVMPLALLALIPFVLVRALRFSARMSSWANVRFRFDGGSGRAFLVYILYPFLAFLSVYVFLPFAARALRGYSIGNHRLGAAPFAFTCRIGPFYAAFLAGFVWIVVVAALLGALLLGPNPILAFQSGTEAEPTTSASLFPISLVFLLSSPPR